MDSQSQRDNGAGYLLTTTTLRWFREQYLDPVHFDVPSDQDRYSKSRIMEESEHIRTLLQESVYDMLRDRRSVWFG